MAYYFDEKYYVASKLAQLKSANEKDPYTGELYTEDGLYRAFEEASLFPQLHYERYGRFEGLNPNPYFNEYEYLHAKLNQLHSCDERYEDGSVYTIDTLLAAIAKAGMTPLEHYERYGAFETDAAGNYINPSNAFDTNAYYLAKLDVCRASGEEVNGKTGNAITLDDVVNAFQADGLSPVTHYALYGAGEANAAGIPFVHPVPMEDRVPNNDTSNPDPNPTPDPNPDPDPDPPLPPQPPVDTSGITARENNGDMLVEGSTHAIGGSSLTLAADGTISDWFGHKNGAVKPTEALGNGKILNASAVTGTGWLGLDTSAMLTEHSVIGSNSANHVTLGAGVTAYTGGVGDDSINLTGPSHDLILTDTSAGVNVLSLYLATNGAQLNLLSGTDFTGLVSGGVGDDSISNFGTITGNIDGGSGNDSIHNSYHRAITGNIYGGDGDDNISNFGTVTGNIDGGDGDDNISNFGTITGDIDGGDGNDVISVQVPGEVIAVICGEGNDLISVPPVPAEVFIGNIHGGTGNDSIEILWSTVNGNITAGSGQDTITLTAYSEVTGIISGSTAQNETTETDTLKVAFFGPLSLPKLEYIDILDLTETNIQELTIPSLDRLPDGITVTGTIDDSLTFDALKTNAEKTSKADVTGRGDWYLDTDTLWYHDGASKKSVLFSDSGFLKRGVQNEDPITWHIGPLLTERGITARWEAGDLKIENTLALGGYSAVTLDADGTILNWQGEKAGESLPTNPLGIGNTLDASAVNGTSPDQLALDTSLVAEAHMVIGSAVLNNWIVLGKTATAYTGGTSYDTILLEADSYSLKLVDTSASAGWDEVYLSPYHGTNLTLLDGTDFDGYIFGREFDDSITLNGTVDGPIYGGDGNDTITVNGTVKCAVGEEADTRLIISGGGIIDGSIDGDRGDDVITINGTVYSAYGGEGDDSITVNGAVEYVCGNEGNDSITIGSGAMVAGYIKGGTGADTIALGGTAQEVLIELGDTGTPTPHGYGFFDTSLCDVIRGIGSGTQLRLSGGWITGDSFWTASFATDFGDNNAGWISGSYNSTANEFTANDTGSDRLLVYDANSAVGTTEAQAVVLVGVGDMTATLTDGDIIVT